MATGISARLSPREGRRFGLTVGTAFLVLAALSWWRGHLVAPAVFAVVGGLLVAAALISPTRLGPAQRGWMGLAHAISRVTTPVFMGIMYFGILTPVGLLRRTFGRSPLRRSPSGSTFWVERPIRRSNLQRQF